MNGLAGFITDHMRKTLRKVSRFAGMHIGQHGEAEAVEAACGEAPQKGNTMKLSAIRAWGMVMIAATGLMGTTGAQAKMKLGGNPSFNTNDCRRSRCYGTARRPRAANGAAGTRAARVPSPIYLDGIDPREFASFVLLRGEAGRKRLRSYFERYLERFAATLSACVVSDFRTGVGR